MNQHKVLIVCADLHIGGAQTVAANIARYADASYHFTYLVFGNTIGEYEKELIEKGNCIVHWNSPSDNYFSFLYHLVKYIKREGFDIVHSHTMFNSGFVMLASFLAGASGRITHSHTTKEERKSTLLWRIYRYAMQKCIHIFGNEFFACGIDAGATLYSDKWFSAKGMLIPNGIDFSKFSFSEKNRNLLRSEMNLEKCLVIGHTGHYVAVKNQVFLIELMRRIRSVNQNAVLLLFGEGEDRSVLNKKIIEYDLSECVYLMGNSNRIHEVLSAFDVFVFPSLFEGTPLALIEAQANGLPCIISDLIPKDAIISNCVTALSLSDSSDIWVNSILNAHRQHGFNYKDISETYGDVSRSMEKIYSIYAKYV